MPSGFIDGAMVIIRAAKEGGPSHIHKEGDIGIARVEIFDAGKLYEERDYILEKPFGNHQLGVALAKNETPYAVLITRDIQTLERIEGVNGETFPHLQIAQSGNIEDPLFLFDASDAHGVGLDEVTSDIEKTARQLREQIKFDLAFSDGDKPEAHA